MSAAGTRAPERGTIAPIGAIAAASMVCEGEGGDHVPASAVHLRDSDAFTWYMERDPLLRSTIVSVAVLDHAPGLEQLMERGERASRCSPGFRHKIVEAPLRLANPRWVADSNFDLSYHCRRIAAPSPATLAEVVRFACQEAMGGFDRDRPLWEFTLVEGLGGGRAALVMKLHHSLTDGVGGMDLARFLFDLEPDPPEPGPMPDAPAGEQPSAAAMAREALGYDWSRVARAARERWSLARADAMHAIRHPASTVASLVDVARSVGRTVRPITDTLSPVMRERRLAWHYEGFELSLEALTGAAHAAGVTLNDAYLGAISGGLLRYHERSGAEIDALRLTMPISIRHADDPIGGNRITLMRFAVPVGLRDPRERMARIHELCRTAREERAVPYTNAIAATLNLLPRGYVAGMLKHVDFLASNVHGIDVPAYLTGARVLQWYAFGPTIGAALNVTLMSYCGTCHIGVNCDTGAVPEPAVMGECLREGFEEILELCGAHEPVRLTARY
jgi:WS/DGAT/MGAT family acyltransferase